MTEMVVVERKVMVIVGERHVESLAGHLKTKESKIKNEIIKFVLENISFKLLF